MKNSTGIPSHRSLSLSFWNTELVSEMTFYTVAIIAAFYFSQLRFGVVGVIPEASLSSLLSGTAPLPLQYRALVPWCAKLILGALKLLHILREPSLESVFQYLELLSIFLLVVAFRSYVLLFLENKVVASFLSFSVLFPLIFHYVLWRPANPLAYLQWFPWDIPSVLLFTVALIMLYKRQWVSYYVVFLIATFNRETTCFLTFIYLFTELGRSKPKIIAFHCVLQVIIWAAVKYFLFWLYMGNSIEGGTNYFSRGLFYAAEFYDGRNLDTVTNIRLYPFLFGVIGYLWIPVVLGLRLVRVHFVKRSLLLVFPFYAGMFYVGAMTELRNFGELVPVVLMAFLLILGELLRLEFSVGDHMREASHYIPPNNNIRR